MRTHIVINSVDYTPYVVEGSYKIGTKDSYESWNDGNMLEHRIIIAQKITGSVQLVCSEMPRGRLASDFLNDIEAATDNGVLTIGVFVPSLGTFKAINCYYSLENTSHIKSIGGKFTDVFELQIKER